MKVVKLLFLFIVAFLIIPVGFAQQFPSPGSPTGMVNDFAGVLDTKAKDELEAVLRKFTSETSTHIAIAIVNDLHGYDVGDYTFRLASDWGVGQKGKDNGVLVLVKPSMGNERGQAYIATGYGLEAAIPDVVVRRIIDNEMIPHFRNNDYYSGLLSAVNVLIELSKGEYTADAYIGKTGAKEEAMGAIIGLIIVIIISVLASRANRARNSSVGHSLPFWVLLSMMGSASGRHSGHYGNFSSGRGSFGGGGFSGFGGGRFGGGGAGGSW
jgi:uncharacterized protein